ncbi:MAG: hypothetical protein KDB26_03795 [Microthrixaceae bacterium]|nr:hypothetical protein [Microthrixaceae bacterium]
MTTVSRARAQRVERTRKTAPPNRSVSVPSNKRGAKRAADHSGDKPVELTVHHRRRISTRAAVISSAMAFFVILLLAVSVQSLRAQTDRQLDNVNSQIRKEAERNLELRAKLAGKESPATIMDQARALGMIDPGPVVPLASPERGGNSEAPGSP